MADKPYILIVEDDPMVQRAYQLKFGKNGVETKSANDGQEAVAFLDANQDNPPKAVILDLMLPFVSGFEILEKMRTHENWKKTPVVILSNLSQEIDIQKAKELGVTEYCVKADIKIDDVVEKISSYLK